MGKRRRSCVSIDDPRPGHRWLLIRRTPRTGELAFFRCYAPHQVPLATLVKTAGRRWTVEENFQASKGLAGLDEHQVRRWISWYRWVTLAMLAAAFLTICSRRRERPRPGTRRPGPADPQRDRPPAHHINHLASARYRVPAALVRLAAAPPAPRQNLPLPAASQAAMNIAMGSGPPSRTPASILACHPRPTLAKGSPPPASAQAATQGRAHAARAPKMPAR